MSTMQARGTLLRASLADRILTYLLLPFGQVGHTNLGKVTASAGSVKIPDDVSTVHLNIEHDGVRPVGRATEITETAEGIVASFKIAATSVGDDLLVEADEGLRPGASVELDNPIIRAGRLLEAVLTGAAAVVTPAFPSAQLIAADAGDIPGGAMDENAASEIVDDLEEAIEVLEDADTQEEITEAVEVLEDALEVAEDEEEAALPEAVAKRVRAARRKARKLLKAARAKTKVKASAPTPAARLAAAGHRPHRSTGKTHTAAEVYRMLAGAYKSGGESKLLAALTNVTHDDGDADGDGLGEITAAPGWLGEVYKKAAYVRKYIPLITTGELTSYRELGFRFSTLPTVAKYTGNKAEVPTDGMTATPVNYAVQRWAHAADLDRRYIDFGDSDVLGAFIEAQVESYKKVTDVETLVNIIANATAFTPGAVPTDINEALAAIVDGALTLIGDDLNPTFAIVGVDLYRGLLLTPKDKITEYLSSAFGLEEGAALGFKIVPSGHADAEGQVVVGDAATVRFKELGGGAPVRVEAEHLSHGGRDLGVFGYTSFQELEPNGVVVADLSEE